ncbi:putative eukaryotic translation initiation factor 3 subunit K-like [Capsicum annuum]|nr:putative eukaryotic translation initiation factor 3 subunit K-like [Capsicum annuum]KAF3675277.1 putative eukaryotic translation initiation factor 3 subunit K-like [Capsicum annuum]
MAAVRHWPLYQLDIKNAFLHGDLEEEVYMEQSLGFVAQGESSSLEFGMIRSGADHLVFYRHSEPNLCIHLVVYVDDIVIIGNDQDGIVVSQHNYVLDILEETGTMGCLSIDTPMDPNAKLLPRQGEPLSDPGRYRRLVGKLNYLTVTKPDISFPMSVVSQYMSSPCDSHWDVVVRILRYIKLSPENLYKDDYGDITRASESTVKDVTPMKFGCDTVRNKLRLSLRKAGHNHVEKPQRSGADEWHVEIAVPKTRKIFMSEVRDEESEGSSVTKAFEKGAETRNSHDVEYEYVHIDDKQECSSGSNLFPDNFHGKEVVGSQEVIAPLGASRRSAVEEISIEEQRYLSGMQDQRSLDSTVTELSSPKLHGCCSHIAKEMKYVRKQLLDIENKQSNLLDLLKEFTSNIVDNLSKIQIKVSGLEGMVDRMTKELSHGGKFLDPATTKFMKRSPAFVSPRLSTYTPRPSVDIPHRKSPLLTTKDVEVRGDRTLVKSRSRSFRNQNLDMWIDPAAKEGGYPIGNGIHQNNGQGTYGGQLRRNKDVFGRICTTNDKQNHLDAKNNLWGVVKGHLLARDVNSAYVEALYSGDELVLFELIDTTGPVLENLSQKTASDLLATLASYYFEQTYVVELSSVQGPDYIVLPTNAKREFLSAFQESVKGGYSAPAERKSLMQLAMTLNQIWGTFAMESKGNTSLPLESDAIGALMARLEALGRKIGDYNDAMKRNLDEVRSEVVTIKGEISIFHGRLECVESRRNSRPSTLNPYHVSSSVQANNSSMTITPETLHQMLHPPRDPQKQPLIHSQISPNRNLQRPLHHQMDQVQQKGLGI